LKNGAFYLDNQAETEDGKVVIIENQLEKTNYDHLGIIITYASGLQGEYGCTPTKERPKFWQKSFYDHIIRDGLTFNPPTATLFNFVTLDFVPY
jgi:hypothetical protein